MDRQMLVNGHRPSSDSSAPVSSAVSNESIVSSSASSIHRHAPASSLSPNSTTSPSSTPIPSAVGTGPDASSPSVRLSDTSHEHSQHQHQLSKDNCDRTRSDEEINPRLVKMSSALVGKTVSPFLKEHIPGLYAPIGKSRQLVGANPNSAPTVRKRDPNSKFCYRHRPDSKCRRAADETKMGFIQSVSIALVNDTAQLSLFLSSPCSVFLLT